MLSSRDLTLLADLVAERVIAWIGGEPWLTVRDASAISGLSVEAIRKRYQRGTLSAIRVGGQLRLRRAEVERLRAGRR